MKKIEARCGGSELRDVVTVNSRAEYMTVARNLWDELGQPHRVSLYLDTEDYRLLMVPDPEGEKELFILKEGARSPTMRISGKLRTKGELHLGIGPATLPAEVVDFKGSKALLVDYLPAITGFGDRNNWI